MIDIDKLKTLPEDTDIGKIRLSDGRWLVVSTMSRIADDTGAGIGLKVVDKKGNELQLNVLTDTTDGSMASAFFKSVIHIMTMIWKRRTSGTRAISRTEKDMDIETEHCRVHERTPCYSFRNR